MGRSSLIGKASAVGMPMLLVGCALFGKGKDRNEEPVAPAAAAADPAPPKTSMRDEQELKLAKLWARVDELEEEQFRQKDQIRVLEKGMTLGLVPEELKRGKGGHAAKMAPPPPLPAPAPVVTPEAAAKPEADDNAAPETAKKEASASEKVAKAMAKEDDAKYQHMLADAHDLYKAGRYGRAIVAYTEISKSFGDKVGEGMHLYWIARCWMELKEYNTAQEHLTEFLKDHGQSAWAPRAKLELARAEWQLDHRESAVHLFHEIIDTYPNADAAEMAKMELENLQKSL